MKISKIAAAAWILLVAVVMGAAVMSEGPSHTPATPPTRTAAVTDIGEAGMLEGDMRMLERMRAAVSPSMNEMTTVDPMWVDRQMIQAHEEYQAQMDRMLARR